MGVLRNVTAATPCAQRGMHGERTGSGRVLVVALAAMLALALSAALPTPLFAQEDPGPSPWLDLVEENGVVEVPYTCVQVQNPDGSYGLEPQAVVEPLEVSTDAIVYVGQAIQRLETMIDISRFNLTGDEAMALYDLVKNSFPDLFYVSGGGYAGYRPGMADYIIPMYDFPIEQIPAMKATYEAKIAEALDWVDAGMGQAEKAKALHDYIVIHCSYAQSWSSDIFQYIHSAYGALVNGSAVCEGYANLYRDLCARAGLGACGVESPNMNHAWNQIMVGDQWYHVDVTWDDPIGGSPAVVRQTYFLKSEDYFSFDHYDWYQYFSSPDTRYDSVTWQTYWEPAVVHPYGFRDVHENDWYVTSGVLEFMVENNLMSGVSDTAFDPNGNMTRAQFATILWRYFEPEADASYNAATAVNETDLPDIGGGQWYTGAANWAVQAGVISGVEAAGGQWFRPDDPVTREQVVTMLLRASGRQFPVSDETMAAFAGYRDAAATSAWARDNVLQALEIGLLKGNNGELRTASSCTRAEGATFIMRAIQQGLLGE